MLQFLLSNNSQKRFLQMRITDTKFRIIITATVFAILLFSNSRTNELFGDADEYWHLSTSFYKSFSHTEYFSFYNFHDPIRGYLFPLTLFPEYVFCYLTKFPPFIINKALGVFWATLLFAWVLPTFWQGLTGRLYRQSIFSFMLLLGFVAWSWGDYFAYPLTDFPALTLFLLALIWLRYKTAGAWLLAGVAFAAALNFRPIYLAAVPGTALLFLYELYQVRKAAVWRLLSFSLGIIPVCVPQFLINVHNFHSYSPLVLGRHEANTSLYQWHLALGMRVQKFESVIVSDPANIKLVVTSDPVGQQLLQKVTGGGAFESMQQYALSVIKHPIDFTTLFARHLFYNLDIRYPVPYLQKLDSKGVLFFIVNFSVIFFGIIMLKRMRFRSDVLFQLLALLLAVAAALPLVVEPRFIMPLHLLLAVAATFGATMGAWWRLLRSKSIVRGQLALAYCIWMLGCLIIGGIAESQTHIEKIGYFSQ